MNWNNDVPGNFHILQVDPWIRTPILVDIGSFTIPLSTNVMIKTQIKRITIPISDNDAGIRIDYI